MTDSALLQTIKDRIDIQDCLSRYARGVDRGDWELVRSTYHPDAIDQHGDYHGDINGLIQWLDNRFKGVDNSMHFLGNCLIEFLDPDHAFVETYFISRRLRLPNEEERGSIGENDQICREAWGRYADHFERRNNTWRVANRVVVIETSSSSIAIDGKRPTHTSAVWGTRSSKDYSYQSRDAIIARIKSRKS